MTASFVDIKEQFDQHFHSFIKKRYGTKDPLSQACSYALEGEGKRVRPLLVLLSNQACGGKITEALDVAVAVEMVHTYSLVHDDLPICDNDDLRRGRPTVHIKFDPATALLCGDALLSDAFTLLTNSPCPQALAMVRELSLAIGGKGMVLGQMMDLMATGHAQELTQLDMIHAHKTGKLIGSACALGGHAAKASQEVIKHLRQFGESVGLAFQIKDDLLDDEIGTGKSLGKDQKQGKLTYRGIMSRQKAEHKARDLTAQAVDLLASLDTGKKKPLLHFVETLLQRKR